MIKIKFDIEVLTVVELDSVYLGSYLPTKLQVCQQIQRNVDVDHHPCNVFFSMFCIYCVIKNLQVASMTCWSVKTGIWHKRVILYSAIIGLTGKLCARQR